ncbi:MAG: NAD(P)(+) transhydrogenase (Re/Si-specific) subunit beta [Planctomycetes bacterium]|nr:NAD(P)(+) transhydrogenase (Re/Si-specific) subunit beta [Planctomycetota bacterium]
MHIYLYIVAAVLFILGIKRLGKVRTARSGNTVAAAGMLLAVLGVLVEAQALSWFWAAVAMAVGSVIGWLVATRVAMTAMPEMVAALNGFGGGASALVAMTEQIEDTSQVTLATFGGMMAIAVPASIVIGSATLTGSGIAYLKLQGKSVPHPIPKAQRNLAHAAIAVAILAISLWSVYSTGAWSMTSMVLLTLLSAVIGVFLVMPIGGADMPVVVALLNSFSGVAAAASGFVIGNQMLIVAGALVGASGVILTQIMCKAMNRSLLNVLIGGVGDGKVAKDAKDYKNIKSTSPEEVAMLLDGASSCVIVPGYGLAVAQAQHACANLAKEIERRGCMVRYAIHPVAGRMPGHMNVLLAEADVPYEKLLELDKINPEFQSTDVVIVVGANDVVNPLAREKTGSPIDGMPILDVDKARTVVMIKRSLSPGYAGVKNPLFEFDNTLMVFLDAKEALQGILDELKGM